MRTFGPYLRWAVGLGGGMRSLDEAFGGPAFAGPGDRVLVPTPTGRHALWHFLEAAELAPGDEVLLAAHNYWVVVSLIAQRGLKPVFVDVDPQTLCMDVADLRRCIGPRAKLVILTHMFGHPGPVAQVGALCREQGLLFFEDCAHAVGSQARGSGGGLAPVGSSADGALYSFGLHKLVNGLGGGMLSLPSGSPLVARAQASAAAEPGAGSPMESHIRAAISVMLHPTLFSLVLGPLLAASPRLHGLIHPTEADGAYRFDPGNRAPFRPFMAEAIARQLEVVATEIEARRAWMTEVNGRIAGVEGLEALEADRHGLANGAYLGLRAVDASGLSVRMAAQGIEAPTRSFLNCAAAPAFSQWARPCPGAATVEAELVRLPSFPHMGVGARARVLEGLAHG